MCAMTGLNIQFLPLFEYGVIIWQVFIRILRYYGAKAVGSIVKKLCKTQVADGTATSSHNNLQSSCNTQCVGWSGTLPLARKGRGKYTSRFTLHSSLKKHAAFTLAEGATHVATSNKIRRAAFTLAEVLITLGIIGVVAAMTLPSLVANYRAQQLRTAFLKGYSIITQAFEMYHNDSQCSTRSCIPGNFYQTMKQYFKIVKLCDNNDTLKSEECIPKHTTDSRYKNFSKKTTGIRSSMFDDGQFVTTDGMLITFEQQQAGNQSIFIGLDTNGRRKSPNVLGQDLFLFQLVDRDGRGFIVPVGRDDTDYPSDEFCNFESTSRENGYGCASRALSEPDFFKKLK